MPRKKILKRSRGPLRPRLNQIGNTEGPGGDEVRSESWLTIFLCCSLNGDLNLLISSSEVALAWVLQEIHAGTV
jgi:hypothetical protein